METPKPVYHRHRFPGTVISYAVRLYFRFQLSLRDIEELLFERGVVLTYETIRRWCAKFGPRLAQCVRQARPRPDTHQLSGTTCGSKRRNSVRTTR